MYKYQMAHLATKQVVLRIALIIAGFELLIMLLLLQLELGLNVYFEAVFDTILLATLSTPIFYFWVIKPFVDSRDAAINQMNHLAHSDSLTGLDNRRSIMRDLEKAVANSVRHKEYAALLLMDLDGFKLVNDNYGHEAGDAVLVTIASRMKSIMRPEDVVGRLGGDEFVILAHRLGNSEAVSREKVAVIAQRLAEEVNKPIIFKDNTLRVNTSIGVRLIGFDSIDVETIMSEVDQAMYRAKSKNGSGVAFVE